MKKRKSAIVFLIILAVIGIISCLFALITDIFDLNNRKDRLDLDIEFYDPNYNSDIMNEQEYLALNRNIMYSDGALTWEIANDNYSYTAGAYQAFLVDYIRTLIAGDGAKLQNMYSDAVIKALDIPDVITEQRIYDIVFTEISRKELKENGINYFKHEVKVEYKIQKNDGVFRSDLPSDAVKAQILVVDEKNTGCLITSVVEYTPPTK